MTANLAELRAMCQSRALVRSQNHWLSLRAHSVRPPRGVVALGLMSLCENCPLQRLRRLLCGRAQPFRTPGLRLSSSGSVACRKATGFRAVLVGLWADPVVTRKFHVASRRINNLRELSGERAAEPLCPNRRFHSGSEAPPFRSAPQHFLRSL